VVVFGHPNALPGLANPSLGVFSLFSFILVLPQVCTRTRSHMHTLYAGVLWGQRCIKYGGDMKFVDDKNQLT